MLIYRERKIKEHVNLCDSKVIWIDEICVDEMYRRRGIGRILMQEVKKEAKGNKCNQIELNCWEFNQSAMKFYEGMGFKTQRRIMEIEI